jgi:hypothetical protein
MPTPPVEGCTPQMGHNLLITLNRVEGVEGEAVSCPRVGV